MELFLRIFQHLLPRARAWVLTIVDKYLRKFFEGLSGIGMDIKEFFDTLWLDIFPEETREIELFENQFGLIQANLTEQQRRDRLTAAWRQQGGQSPRYIEDQLRAAGFDVYVHEWWELPVVGSPTPRNPFTTLISSFSQAGEPLMEAGEPEALAGNFDVNAGFVLVNKVYNLVIQFVGCGNEQMNSGYPGAVCGRKGGSQLVQKVYIVPDNPLSWRHFIYIGAETFPDFAIVDTARRNEFETLCLKLKPAEKWLGMLITYEADTT